LRRLVVGEMRKVRVVIFHFEAVHNAVALRNC
jgi:hypothetical protein